MANSECSAGRGGAAVVPTTAQTDVLRQQVLAANQAANARQSVSNATYEAAQAMVALQRFRERSRQ
jgi:hypothetical protein